jgi:hypothetical protein
MKANIRQASSNLYPQYCDVSLHWQTKCPSVSRGACSRCANTCRIHRHLAARPAVQKKICLTRVRSRRFLLRCHELWRMRIACWITMATNTHSEYVILMAFPRQQCLWGGKLEPFPGCRAALSRPDDTVPSPARLNRVQQHQHGKNNGLEDLAVVSTGVARIAAFPWHERGQPR